MAFDIPEAMMPSHYVDHTAIFGPSEWKVKYPRHGAKNVYTTQRE